MDIKDQISHLKESDPKLFNAISAIIDAGDVSKNLIDTLLADLKRPDVAYGHSHVPKAARIWRSTDQNIAPSAAGIAVTFDTVIFDNDAMWAAGQPTRLTIKTPGKYLVGGCVFWDVGGGTRSLMVRKNGATSVVRSKFSIPAGETANCANEAATYYRFLKDDYIELIVAQTGVAIALPALVASDYSIIMWAVLIERDRNAALDTENFVPGDM
jgi:hypothetical protein